MSTEASDTTGIQTILGITMMLLLWCQQKKQRVFHLVCLFLLVHRETTGSDVHKKDEAADDRERLKEIVLEKITLRMRAVHAPPIIRKDVENTEQDDEEGRGPFCFEANGYHRACCETEERHEYATYVPLSLDDEAEEEEDEEDAASKEEVFLAVCFAHGRDTGKAFLFVDHGFAKHHDETAYDAQVAKEESEVEHEAISEALNDNYAKETDDCVFCVPFHDDG